MDTQSDRPNKLKREYDRISKLLQECRNSLPDVQNSGCCDMQGANVPILQVGISGFRCPALCRPGRGRPRYPWSPG